MNILTFEGGFDHNFSYLIWCPATRKSALVDASVSPMAIFNTICQKGLKLQALILTHSHSDHTMYSRHIIRRYPDISMYGYDQFIHPLPPGNFVGVRHGSNIEIGERRLQIMHTPGHFPDSICLWDMPAKQVFTGDTVFVGRTGRVIHPGSDLTQLYHSVYDIILRLPGDTTIFPGHNYGDHKTTTIGKNIQTSPFFNCANLSEFTYVMNDFEENR